jgi:hypothetical protein
MGVFDGIEHVVAEGTSLRKYFEPGNYIVNIDTVFLYEKRLGGGKLFIVETTVDTSDNPSIKSGEKCNWVQSFALPSALARIKAFVIAAMALCSTPTEIEILEITADLCNKIVDPQNPLRNKKLKLTCIGKTTSKGKKFIQHIWTHI